FADAADGTGWGEGAGLLLLEKLSDARANGHQILAVVRGSAVNQDGASNGLTAPNGPSQQRLIRTALTNAGLSPSDVDAVEAHGTGTTLGDPIEAQALLRTYGQNRPDDRPLYLGSVKSNIGHTQAAAGAAGLIKMIGALHHGVLPATLHVDQPSHHVDWTSGHVQLLTGTTPWPDVHRARRAAVSSFGISGTNAHVILEQAPDQPGEEPAAAGAPMPAAVEPRAAERSDPAAPPAAGVTGGPLAWLLSARSAQALAEQARRLQAFLDGRGGVDLTAIGSALATARATLEERAVLLGSDETTLRRALDALARGDTDTALARGTVPAAGTGRTAFLFTGQGSQRPGMIRELYAAYPRFATALDTVTARLDDALAAIPARSTPPGTPSAPPGGTGAAAGAVWPALRDVLHADPQAEPETAALIHQTVFAQTGLFAFEVALHELVRSAGIVADHLIGHSIGELTAAHVAGVLTLDDAARLVAARARLMQDLPAGGAMISVAAPEPEVLAVLADLAPGADVGVAAVNGPSATVISGDAEATRRVAARLAEQGRRTRELTVSHAFHSPHMDGMLDDFAAFAATLSYAEPAIPVISNLTGAPADPAEISTPGYWVRHVRDAVRFHQGVRALRDLGVTTWLELGPDSTLTGLAQASLADDAASAQGRPDGAGGGDTEPVAAAAPLAVPALRRGRDGAETLLAALAALHVHGHAVDWRAVLPDPGTGRTGPTAREAARVAAALPTYPFQRRTYWLPAGAGAAAGASELGLTPVAHPLLGAVVPLADGDRVVLTGRLSTAAHPWLADHVVAGRVLMPGTGLLDLVLHAAGHTDTPRVEELTLREPLALHGEGTLDVQIEIGGADPAGARALTVHSRPAAGAGAGAGAAGGDGTDRPGWRLHATAVLTAAESGGHDQVTDGGAGALDPGFAELAGSWPPAAAEPVDLDGLYDALAGTGLDYGPAFQGLRAAWRRGAETFTEVVLPDGEPADAGSFGVHPALLDAALHPLASRPDVDRPAGAGQPSQAADGLRLPFSWSGVTLHGPGPRALRVRLSPAPADAGRGAVSLLVADGTGAPVVSVRALAVRTVHPDALAAADSSTSTAETLFTLRWDELTADGPTAAGVGAAGSDAGTGRWLVIGRQSTRLAGLLAGIGLDAGAHGGIGPSPAFGADPETPAGRATAGLEPAAVRAGVAETLAALQDVLAAEDDPDGTRVLVVTEGALAAAAGDLADPAQAPSWGLVRTAQSEYPGRFVLLDLPARAALVNTSDEAAPEDDAERDHPELGDALRRITGAAVTAGENQFAVRDGAVLVPRLVRAPAGERPGRHLDPAGTVLVTGGTGTLGALAARHLVTH
ncbi:polyketide synthase dehydratase domain-containing protein, partial [Frankia sp. Cpl3]|nr:polyketide synthase dehydratase domain-containing protein [Frankia sp. Cpl3]